jgi:superfamily II DNA helicase RecQ
VRGETPYIVAIAALGTGIDVPGITHIIHLEAPHSLIDYAQEAGRAGRGGERVKAQIIVEEKDWPAADPQKDSCLELKMREVNSLIRTTGCRRSILGRCLDGNLRDCKEINAILCDNCRREALLWKSELSS